MRYACKKIDDCFSDSRTWQYALDATADDLVPLLEETGYQVDVNRKYRRPFFIAENEEGLRVKGVLNRSVVNASFPLDGWEESKARFEAWLEAL